MCRNDVFCSRTTSRRGRSVIPCAPTIVPVPGRWIAGLRRWFLRSGGYKPCGRVPSRSFPPLHSRAGAALMTTISRLAPILRRTRGIAPRGTGSRRAAPASMSVLKKFHRLRQGGRDATGIQRGQRSPVDTSLQATAGIGDDVMDLWMQHVRTFEGGDGIRNPRLHLTATACSHSSTEGGGRKLSHSTCA